HRVHGRLTGLRAIVVPFHPVPRSRGVPGPLAGALRRLGHHAPDVYPGRRRPSDATHSGRRGHVPRTQVPAPDDRAGTVSGRVARTVALRQAGTPGGAAAAHPELVRQVSTGETDYRVQHAMTASRHRRPRVSRRPITAGRRPTVPCQEGNRDRKSTRLNSSHEWISYAVFCLKKKKKEKNQKPTHQEKINPSNKTSDLTQ